MDDLNVIMKEVYILVAKVGFEAAYVDSIPPIERELYLMHFKEDIENSKKKESGNSPMMGGIGAPIDPMG